MRWLATIAEEKGVDIFPDTPASALLYKDDKVEGVITADKGVDKNGKPREDFQRGYALHSKFTVLAEGVLGSLTEDVSRRFHLQREQRTYGLGIKEIWDIPGSDSLVGTVVHTLGLPAAAILPRPSVRFPSYFHLQVRRWLSLCGVTQPRPHRLRESSFSLRRRSPVSTTRTRVSHPSRSSSSSNRRSS